MTTKYPTDTSYLPPKNLLLISCIDLRLTDDLARFMDHENLTNRYDHVILAGASLGVSLGTKEFEHWRLDDPDINPLLDPVAWWTVLKQHIDIAVALHHIEDVYIVEHEQCGAYKTFVKPELIGTDDPKSYRKEEPKFQEKSAMSLAKKISAATYQRYNDKKKKVENYQLKVHCFRMDLRGGINKFPLNDEPAAQQTATEPQQPNA